MSAAQAAYVGWGLLALVLLVMMPAIVWPMLDDAGGSADIHRIEHGIGVEDDDGPCTCAGRHCRECGAAGTRAQQFPELLAVQRDAHRWNLPTMAMPVIEDIVPIVGVIAGEFEPLPTPDPGRVDSCVTQQVFSGRGYPTRVTPTDLDDPTEPPVWLTEKVRLLAPARADRRERVAA